MRRVLIDQFCMRQFDKQNKSAIQIESTAKEMEDYINQHYNPQNLKDGYAPFCKHIFLPNYTQTKVSTIKITQENEHLLRSHYQARTEKELPVLQRYFPQGSVEQTVGKFLDIILYSREQIIKENKAMNQQFDENLDYDWGVVSIKIQDVDYEIPMDPITMMRNALGVEHGGSGIPLDRQKYLDSVKFYSEHALVR